MKLFILLDDAILWTALIGIIIQSHFRTCQGDQTTIDNLLPSIPVATAFLLEKLEIY